MKKRLYRVAALLAAVVLLAGCGASPVTTEEEADVTGRYYLVGTTEKAAAVLNEDNYLRLKENGTAIYQIAHDQLEYKWKLKDDGALTLTLDGEKTAGTLADGVITIRLDGSDRVFVKGKNAAQKYIDTHADTILVPPTDRPDGSTAADTKAPDTTEAPSPSTEDTKAPDTTAAPDASTASSGPFDPDVRFTGTDQYGNEINENVFREHVLTMINFWEPWCGPCVGEMPELEQLYQDRGGELLILGVYWTEDGAAEVLSETGVTYPVILFDSAFGRYQTGYVPTTIFVDPGGHVIGQPYVGARSGADWNEIVTGMIGH